MLKFSLYKIVNIRFILTVFFLFTEIILQYFILLNNNFITVLTIDFLCFNIRFYIYPKNRKKIFCKKFLFIKKLLYLCLN